MRETWGVLSAQVAKCRKRAFSRHCTTSCGSEAVTRMLVSPAEASWLRGICCSMVVFVDVCCLLFVCCPLSVVSCLLSGWGAVVQKWGWMP